MKRVPMPADTNEQVVFAKRSMEEAWPGFDESAFRHQLTEANEMVDRAEAQERAQYRADVVVNVVVVLGFVFCMILLVSGS